MFAGIDFGTSNSAVSLAGVSGDAAIVPMRHSAGSSDTLRSMLAFDKAKRDDQSRLLAMVGQDAVEAYLKDDGECRLLQSFKSYLTSRAFSSASIFGTSFSLEDMIALVVGHLRRSAAAVGGSEVTRVVAGRPVRFVAEDGRIEDDYALGRLQKAFAQAGLEEVNFEFEPIAAACYYERTLDHDETVLVADFGGGTSDFCLVRLGPNRAGMSNPQEVWPVTPSTAASSSMAWPIIWARTSPSTATARICRFPPGCSASWAAGTMSRSSTPHRPCACYATSSVMLRTLIRSRIW